MIKPNANGEIGLVCLCSVRGQERRATYSPITPELLAGADITALRRMLQVDLSICLGEPDLKLLSFEPVQLD
jgi:hypothetical protein